MNFEFNPFRLLLPPGGDPITSISVTSNLDWYNVPDGAILGPEAVLDISAKTDVAALKVFGTGAFAGVPSMITLQAGHIPPLSISQITGLQDALNSLVKSIASGNSTALSVTNNGVGDYLITPNFGTVVNKIAQGNDSRFPSNVTGLRKGAGVASLDIAAVAKTDYWDTSVFVASGSSHAKGLVPDPGGTTGIVKFLCEDGLWKTPAGTGTVTSIGVTVPSDFAVAPSTITGSGVFAITRNTQTQNKFLASPISSTAAPTYRTINFADVSALSGATSVSFAAGNDARFSSSVTGIRMSSGLGSTDVPAVANVDYWDADVFVGTGPSHAKGLVPDPGPGLISNRFLKEDGTWQAVVFTAAGITNSQLDNMPAHTVKGNITGSLSSPTDVTPINARSASLLNIESIRLQGDGPVTLTASDRYVATSATLTASRTWTLPLANSTNPGQLITISDNFGGLSGNFVIYIARQGSDTIQGSSAAIQLDTKYANATLASDGINKWFLVNRSPALIRKVFTSSGTYTTPTGVKALVVEVIAGGGGGGGAAATSGTATAGGGGGGGGYASSYITDLLGSYTYAVGLGGAPGTSGGTDGQAGQDSFFGSNIYATGGAGAGGSPTGGSTPAFIGNGGPAGAGTFGDVKAKGGGGRVGVRLSATQVNGGHGGGSFLSGSPQGGATGYFGAGGGGGFSIGSGNQAGGSGAQGIIILTEYY